MIQWLLLSTLAAAAISFLVCGLMVRLGERGHGLDRPGAQPHKAHERAVPNLGGIGIFHAVLWPLLLAWAVAWWAPHLLPETLQVHVPGARRISPMGMACAMALTLLHGIGLIDDRIGTPVIVRLAAQLVIAALLAAFFEIRIFQFMETFGPLGVLLSVLVSTIWIVLVINAMNMLDNMDGLSAGVTAIIATGFVVTACNREQWFVAAAGALLIGACLGFLPWNFPHARLFMGDAGSMVVGLLLAVVSVRLTYHDPDVGHGDRLAWMMPLLAMFVPAYDLLSVVAVRLRQRRRPWDADQNHLSHRLVRRGLSRRAAVMVIWAIAATTTAFGVGFAIVHR